jgi:hypothetical protein
LKASVQPKFTQKVFAALKKKCYDCFVLNTTRVWLRNNLPYCPDLALSEYLQLFSKLEKYFKRKTAKYSNSTRN